MANWAEIIVNDFHTTDKLVGEYRIYSNRTGNFIVRIYEGRNGKLTGFTNLKVKSLFDGCPEGGVGHGETIEETLEDTLEYFNEMLNERETLSEDDFVYVGYDEF